MFMSPSCVCDATAQPPAHTGMNAQSPHSFHGLQPIEPFARAFRATASRRSSMCPVDSAGSPVNPGHGVERSVRADRVRVLLVDLARAHVHAVDRREAAALGLLAQERHLLVEEVAGVAGRCRRRRPPTSCTCRSSGLPFAADRGQRDACPSAVGAFRSRMIGLKLTLTSLSAKSCSRRKSSSAG